MISLAGSARLAPDTGCDGHLAALAALDRVGPARLRWLVGLGTPAEVWSLVARGALPARGAPGLERGLLERWRRSALECPDLPERMRERMAELGVGLTVASAMPTLLADDPDPPGVLFHSGSTDAEFGPTVAIVGTRRASPYGLRVARQLGNELSARGVTIVSGLALGIDAAAHAGAVEGASPPIGVIGSGHDRPCPRRNRPLAGRVARHGLLLGEVPPGVGSAPWRFPVRNRLIAALSQVLVVVESATTGGSMSTVSEALARGRPVMAVPGAVGRVSSEGCHELLRDGAHICTCADDVASLLGIAVASATGSQQLPPGATARGCSGLEARILEELAGDCLTLDAVTLRCASSPGDVSRAVGELERKGLASIESGWLRRRGG